MDSLASLRRYDPDQVRRVGGFATCRTLSAQRTPGNLLEDTMSDKLGRQATRFAVLYFAAASMFWRRHPNHQRVDQ